MCGIAGIYLIDKPPVSSGRETEKIVKEMSGALAHRGPDRDGYWSDYEAGIFLGHRRLSIVDLSDNAAQPMTNDDGSVVIVYNGEIYNAGELRRELESTGRFSWKTDHCDTEVVLRAYEQWGESCLERLRGMFAFAIWDGRKRTLWLARDRIGIKPLYYTFDGRRFAFASEIKALLYDPHFEPRVDHEALYHYLTFFVAPPPKTMFEGVKKLPAGSSVSVAADGKISERRWWDLLEAARPLDLGSIDDYAEVVRSELEKSIEIHKMSDVPVGVFLSGGLDSSTNAYFFARGEPKPIRTFSVGYAGSFESYKNEYSYARLMANAVSARHYEVDMSDLDFASYLPAMARQLDEPLGDPVAVSIYYLSALARNEGVTVCQVGEGSDELFGGYRSWQALVAIERFAAPLPGAFLSGASHLARLAYRKDERPALWVSRMARGVPPFWGGAEGFTDQEKKALLSKVVLKDCGDLTSWDAIEPYWKKFDSASRLRSPLQWMSYLDLSFRIPELLLMRVDKMSMASGLEARVPFLDHRFVELVMGIPEKIRMRYLRRKYLLRAAMRDILPPAIATRSKQGFRVPIAEWLNMPRFEKFVTDIVSSFADESGLLNRSTASTGIHRTDKRKVWLLLVLALWWKQYLGSEEIDMARWFPELEPKASAKE